MANTNPELISKDIVDLQDIEKIQFLQTLQADPAKYSAYVAEKKGHIIGEVMDTKRAAFIKSSGDMARLMDMDHNSQAAFMRTQDLLAVEGDMTKQQKDIAGAGKYNADLTRRQVEINNWYYENKRETLFVLQFILLTMLTVTLILVATAYGFVSQAAADYLMGFVIVVGVGTWLYRWFYTKRVRDSRFWNRRVFQGDGKEEPPSGQICFGESGETKPVGPDGKALLQ
jgi:hypothetical protein